MKSNFKRYENLLLVAECANELTKLLSGDTALLYLYNVNENDDNGQPIGLHPTKVKAVFCENIDKGMMRQNLSAEQIATHFKSKSFGNAFVSKYNASDERFTGSYQYCSVTIELTDLIVGLGLDEFTMDDFVDDSELAIEKGKTVYPLFILNPVDVDENTRLRIQCTEDTEPQVNKSTGFSYDLANLEIDENGKSSAKQNGRGGDIMYHNGKPIFMRRNICFANDPKEVEHLTLLPDLQLENKSEMMIDVEQVETVSDELNSL